MQTVIRKLGNSKGLIIPASFLANLGIKESVEMQLKDQSIIITAINKNPRDGWYNNYQQDKEDDDAWQDFQSLASEEEDWQW